MELEVQFVQKHKRVKFFRGVIFISDFINYNQFSPITISMSKIIKIVPKKEKFEFNNKLHS